MAGWRSGLGGAGGGGGGGRGRCAACRCATYGVLLHACYAVRLARPCHRPGLSARLPPRIVEELGILADKDDQGVLLQVSQHHGPARHDQIAFLCSSQQNLCC